MIHQLPHFTQPYFLMVWFSCSIINWFFLMGEYNHSFRQKLKNDDGCFWIIAASVFAGINGLIGTICVHRCKHIAWRPLTKKEKEQIIMLKMFEDDSMQSGNQNYDTMRGGSVI